MDRRHLLATAPVLAAALIPVPTLKPAADNSIEQVLFGRATADPQPLHQIAAQVAAARADYRACQFARLAQRVPRLLSRAASTLDAATGDRTQAAGGLLAQAYCVATQLLIKLHDDGMAYATADRAVRAARNAADPMITSDATRLAATVLRRTGHHDSAQQLALQAARQLAEDTGLDDPAHAGMYGQILAVAAYTSAVGDNRDNAYTLLTEAQDATRRVGTGTPTRFGTDGLALYNVSIARVLGDYGTAIDHARNIDPTRIVALERRTRYWQDTALALHGRGRPAAAFRVLQAAERDAPEEIRYRPWARQLTIALLRNQAASPGIRDFAQRVGIR